MEEMNFIEMFKQGGFIMYPLLALSIIAWAIAIQKYFSLRSFVNEYERLYRDLGSLLASGRYQDIEWHFKKASAPIALAHEAIFDQELETREDINERTQRRLDAVQAHLRKRLWALGTIASTTPFVGLFGTVVGIMASFKAMGQTGKGGMGVVSAGIAEALIATAAGIIIAVVAVALFNFLQTKSNEAFSGLKEKVEDLAQIMVLAKKEAAEIPPATPRRTNRVASKQGVGHGH